MLPLHSHEPGEISSQLSITAATQDPRRTAVEATHCRHVSAGGSDTEYVKGFRDMAAYWKLPCEEFQGHAPGDADIEHYVEEWDTVEYAKAILYGQVVTALIGCLYCEFFFHLPFGGKLIPYNEDIAIPLLYTVRKPLVGDSTGGCELVFPSRYHEKSNLTLNRDNIDVVIGCFKGELPKIIAEIVLCDDIDSEFYDLLTNVVYLGIHGGVFEQPSSNFVEQVIQRSTSLEVVILEGYFHQEEEPTSVNELVNFLSTQVAFLSRFRILKILTNLSEYTVLQKNLNKLITAYFSAPTTCLQKIQITDTEIKSYDSTICPVIDHRYLQFKIIELVECHFVSKQKSTCKAITQWLGRDISTLPVENSNDNRISVCAFKVKEQSLIPGLLGRKRKRSEVDSEDTI